MTNDERAEIVLDVLEWQISAVIGARNTMRIGSPSHRFADAYAAELIRFSNILRKYGGGVYSPEFSIDGE